MRTVIALTGLMLLAPVIANAAELENLLTNPGFEDGAAGWEPTGDGFTVDTGDPHSGANCIRLDKPEGVHWVGCRQEIVLDQQAPTPIVAWAWCRTENVLKVVPSSFCVYMDIEFQQDTRPDRVDLPGQTVTLGSGTEDWRYREMIFNPEFAIKSIKFYLLFRGAPTGTAWLDDIGLAEMSSGPLTGGPDDFPPLPLDNESNIVTASILASEPADSWQVYRAGDSLAMPGQIRSLPADPEHAGSATWLAPVWRGEVPLPDAPEAGMALHFMRRWERRSLMADHGGEGDGTLLVTLPAGLGVDGVEMRDWDVRDDSVALYAHEGRVIVRINFAGDDTPDRLIIRLADAAEAATRQRPDALTTVGDEDGLKLGFGPDGALWQITSDGTECADPATSGGMLVGALDDGEMLQVGGDMRTTDDDIQMLTSLESQELQVEARFRDAGDCIVVSGEVRDMRGVDRALDVLFELPIATEGWRWHQNILSATDLDGETSIETADYPLAAVTRADGSAGLGIAMDPELPVDFRLGFDPERHRLYLRLKMGVSPDAKTPGRARFSFMLAPVDPAWGMRDLLATWYRTYPAAFERRAMREGCWLFAIAPTKVPNPQDYGYYEGSQDTDFVVEHGIAACPYVIPGQRSITRLESMPASYDEAMKAFDAYDPSVGNQGPQVKELIENCRVMTPDGFYPIRIRDDVGADIKPVFSTNCDPDLMADEGKLNVGRWTLDVVRRLINQEPRIGGIYVDSAAGWVARYLNVRRDHFPYADYPLTYVEETGELAIDGRFSVVEFLRGLGDLLHPEGLGRSASSGGAGGLPEFVMPPSALLVILRQRRVRAGGSRARPRSHDFLPLDGIPQTRVAPGLPRVDGQGATVEHARGDGRLLQELHRVRGVSKHWPALRRGLRAFRGLVRHVLACAADHRRGRLGAGHSRASDWRRRRDHRAFRPGGRAGLLHDLQPD